MKKYESTFLKKWNSYDNKSKSEKYENIGQCDIKNTHQIGLVTGVGLSKYKWTSINKV